MKGFKIILIGDPSVGIHTASITIDGLHYFEDKNDLKSFRKQIKTAYEAFQSDDVRIYTFEELEAMKEYGL